MSQIAAPLQPQKRGFHAGHVVKISPTQADAGNFPGSAEIVERSPANADLLQQFLFVKECFQIRFGTRLKGACKRRLWGIGQNRFILARRLDCSLILCHAQSSHTRQRQKFELRRDTKCNFRGRSESTVRQRSATKCSFVVVGRFSTQTKCSFQYFNVSRVIFGKSFGSAPTMLPTVILMQPLGKWPLMKVKFSRRESFAFKAIHFSVTH